MAMVSCRKAFTAKLLQNAKKNADIFAVATDSRGSVTLGEFGKQLPDRLIEFGIAEQNAVAAAAGLAKTGKKVFVTGPACFLAARAYEQVRWMLRTTGRMSELLESALVLAMDL